jgi:hypothetical protein
MRSPTVNLQNVILVFGDKCCCHAKVTGSQKLSNRAESLYLLGVSLVPGPSRRDVVAWGKSQKCLLRNLLFRSARPDRTVRAHFALIIGGYPQYGVKRKPGFSIVEGALQI